MDERTARVCISGNVVRVALLLVTCLGLRLQVEQRCLLLRPDLLQPSDGGETC
jgi:hypothetical protein